MRGLRYDRILAGTALALVLALPTVPMRAAWPTRVPHSIEARGADCPMATAAAAADQRRSSRRDARPRDAQPRTGRACRADAGRGRSRPPPAAPDPLAALDPADRPIAEKVRDLLAAKVDKIFANKKERAAVEAFYQNRKSRRSGSTRASRTRAPRPSSHG